MGELYFKASEIASDKSINDYNEYLVEWEQDQGYSIVNDSGLVTISAYETITLKILQRLLDFTQAGIKGQKRTKRTIYKKIIQHSLTRLMFPSKKAIKYAFVNSRILLIYGAAGTGKTTLINYISSLMPKSKKLFLTKTHMLPFNTFKEELIIQDQILILFVLIVLQEELICQIMILFL